MTAMASHRGVLVAMVLFAIAAACGISAVGQRIEGDPTTNPEAGNGSSTSGGTDSSSSSSGSGGVGDGDVPDAPADAPFDATPGCPTACNGGCDGGCNISGEGGA